MASLILKKGKEGRLLNGHPWVYAGEVGLVKGGFDNGDIVDIRDASGRFLARGYANRASQIRARILTYEKDEEVDTTFFYRRIEAAVHLRKQIVSETDTFRLVYSEGDLLPGLIVDRYGSVLVVQFLTAGMERRKREIVNVLDDLLRPSCIYERSDLPVREQEGLSPTKGILSGVVEVPVHVEESGRRFLVDIANGQKTGFFLDQRENRSVVPSFSRGARVLDVFCYTGGFSVYAATAGATHVTGIDISAEAVALAGRHARLNDCTDRCRFTVGNAFDMLRRYDEAGERYDLIVLDPPSFTRGKEGVEGAIRGYKEINLRALKILSPGGYLVTCSCSYHIDEGMFTTIVLDAARDTRRILRLLEARSQAKDHPVLLTARETHYLKCLILQVV
ncbi:MAG: class I SAM-dependent rRNA methyltransferase [Candidatus Latescibacteria bacterium]|nr:class I SAM-dependent rRNA methyltransferase [Candidatus Latescibacterota bacterium]